MTHRDHDPTLRTNAGAISTDSLNAWVTYGQHRTVLRTYINSCDTAYSDQLESRLATLDSSQEALLQVMSVNQINTVKPAQ